jgi:hypothetical protein
VAVVPVPPDGDHEYVYVPAGLTTTEAVPLHPEHVAGVELMVSVGGVQATQVVL